MSARFSRRGYDSIRRAQSRIPSSSQFSHPNLVQARDAEAAREKEAESVAEHKEWIAAQKRALLEAKRRTTKVKLKS